MNSPRKKLILMSGLLLCTLIQKLPANPNHLEPITPYNYYGYEGAHQVVFNALIGDVFPQRLSVVWMLEWPCFDQASAVVLRHEVQYDPNDTRPYGKKKVIHEEWLLEDAVLKTWRTKTLDDGRKVFDIQPAQDVETHRTAVTKDFAAAVKDGWLSVLELTRYPDVDFLGLDGTTFHFYCDGLFGQTWSPDTGLPARLVDLAHKLRAIARADDKTQGPLLAEAEKLATKIAKDAAAEQKRVFGRRRSRTIPELDR